MNTCCSFPNVAQKLFGHDTELFASVNELFEIEMANLEYAILSQQQLVNRSAFFKSINGQLTKHLVFKNYEFKSGTTIT